MLIVSKIDRNENIEYFDDGWVGKGIPHRKESSSEPY